VLLNSQHTALLGSIVFIEAATLEEVKTLIESDVFYTENVVSGPRNGSRRVRLMMVALKWDKAKLQIFPYMKGFGSLRRARMSPL
jgi:hypothetical protein